MSLNETTIERLSFNKYLVDVGLTQASEPQPMAATAVLSFHDAVEIFLQHAAEFLNAARAGNSHVRFMEYWEIINTELPGDQQIGQKPSMRRLNEARVNLKHQGTRPTSEDIQSFGIAVRNFFEENVPIVFGIDYNEISLVYLVEYESTREKLNQALEYLGNGERNNAVENIALAYSNLFFEYNERMREEFGYQPFAIDNSRGVGPSERDIRRDSGRDMARFYRRVDKTINSIEDAIQVLSLGIDYRRYSKFQSLTPSVIRTIGGGANASAPDDREYSHDEVEFCLDFVVDAAIQLQKMDASLDE